MLNLADKMVFLEKQMLVKYKEVDSEQSETQPKLELVIKRTKEMQKQVCIIGLKVCMYGVYRSRHIHVYIKRVDI